MAARRGDGQDGSVLWWEDLDGDLLHGGSGALPTDADVVVVGSGYCGLAAATELASAGRAVVVLERDRLGAGASTRNGGMVIPELRAGPRTLERRLGPLGLRLHDEVERAFDHVESLVAGDAPAVDCDYERTGQLYLTHAPAGVRHLHELAAEHESIGNPATVLTGENLHAEVGSELFTGGLVLERTGGLHPARFHAGLVARAADAGAALHARVAVTAVRSARRSGGPVEVRTAAGILHARDVLLATNAYADGAHPPLERRVLPMGSFIIATEPLPAELATTVLPTRRMAFNDRNLLWYRRHGPGGRLLFGGRRRLGAVGLDEARGYLRASMVRVHPQLRDVRVERAWGGLVALTLDRLPHCGVERNVWYATGCNGSGVALNTWMGYRMARAILGDELPPFAEIPHRPIPLRPLRSMWLPVVGKWFEVQDRRGERVRA